MDDIKNKGSAPLPSAAMNMETRDGLFFPIMGPDRHSFAANIDKLGDLKVQNDDILVMAFPKSGTHWVAEIIGMLLAGSTTPMEKEKESCMFELLKMDAIDDVPPPRIFNTHYWPRHIPLELIRKCKLFYLVRNPKDIVVSLYCHYSLHMERSGYAGPTMPFKQFLLAFTHAKEGKPPNSWFGYVEKFEELFRENKDLQPLIVYYEDLMKEPLANIKRILQHLGKTHSEEFLHEVLDACHIDKMREYAKNRVEKSADWMPPETKDGGLYRKGNIGDWKNWFTVADSEMFDSVFNERMRDSELKTFSFE